jgi:SAM-dependent methyltransferase
MLRRFLCHPCLGGSDPLDCSTLEQRRAVLARKPFLRKVYAEWYQQVASALPVGQGPVLELGTGAGFLREFVPGLITSDVFFEKSHRLVADAVRLPLADGSLAGIAMINVLHHVASPVSFFEEVTRCLRPGGVVVMIEPWVTLWSSLVYRSLHHEPFDPRAASPFSASRGAPLSRPCNNALAWILFQRDRAAFAARFAQLRVHDVRLCTPFCYLAAGGMAYGMSMPSWSYGAFRRFEGLLAPCRGCLAMFACIRITRTVP